MVLAVGFSSHEEEHSSGNSSLSFLTKFELET